MKIGIVIPTYWRKDGTSKEVLNRALQSVAKQTYSDYKVFLMGDHYELEEELIFLSKIIQPDKIHVLNLPEAIERSKYSGRRLWCTGGVNATNIGINLCLEEGIHRICHLDHDDWWEPTHLEEIVKAFSESNYTIVATLSTHTNKQLLPRLRSIPFYPMCNDLIHSSVCIDFKNLDIRYRDTYESIGKDIPADCDLWTRLTDHMKQFNLTGRLVNTLTCNHLTEGYSKKN